MGGVETLLGAEGAEVVREEVTQSGPSWACSTPSRTSSRASSRDGAAYVVCGQAPRERIILVYYCRIMCVRVCPCARERGSMMRCCRLLAPQRASVAAWPC